MALQEILADIHALEQDLLDFERNDFDRDYVSRGLVLTCPVACIAHAQREPPHAFHVSSSAAAG